VPVIGATTRSSSYTKETSAERHLIYEESGEVLGEITVSMLIRPSEAHMEHHGNKQERPRCGARD